MKNQLETWCVCYIITLLSAEITLYSSPLSPHIEDASWDEDKLEYHGRVSNIEFKAILDDSLSDTVKSGFGVELDEGQKHIPLGTHAKCSIITIKIPTSELSIYKDQHNPGRIKAFLLMLMGIDSVICR